MMSDRRRYKSLKTGPEEKGLHFTLQFSSWRNIDSDEAALTEEGKPFHALDAVTGSARSPSVERFVGATTNVSETEERRQRRPWTSAVRRRLSERYVGAVLWRQRSTKTHSWNRIRTRIHSQWSSCNGDTSSDFLAEKTAWVVHSGLTEKA